VASLCRSSISSEMYGISNSHGDKEVVRRLAMQRRPKMRQFLDPISVPIPSGPLRADIALGIALCKELGPRGDQLVWANTSEGGSHAPDGLRRLLHPCFRRLSGRGLGLAHPCHCLWTRDPEDLAAVGGRLRSRASRVCGS